MSDVSGHLDARFTRVADAFLDGFESGREVGAALCVIVGGRPVVDIWHGHRDRRRTLPWERDTLVCMFSVTKAMTTTCLLQAVERGLLTLDAPVADYWPEFARRGKERITLRQLMTHQAGLVGFHDPVARDLLYDWPGCIAALEREFPWWTPGTRHGYHARTFGYLLGEVLRRVSGRSLGTWFRDEVAAPLNLDFAIGLKDADLGRCAEMLPARVRAGADRGLPPSSREMMHRFNDLTTPTGAAFQNPAMRAGYMNTDTYRRAELPAANGHGTARAAAAMHQSLGTLLSAPVLEEATTTHSLGPDEVLLSPSHFGLGFMLFHEDAPIGIRHGSFGHAGAGGSMAFHDPQADLSFCFAMNQMELGVVTGGRTATATAAAVYECLESP